MNFKDILSKYRLSTDDTSKNFQVNPNPKQQEPAKLKESETTRLKEVSDWFADFNFSFNGSDKPGKKLNKKVSNGSLFNKKESKSKRFSFNVNPSLIIKKKQLSTESKKKSASNDEKEEAFKNLIHYQVNSGKRLLDDEARFQQEQLKHRSVENFQNLKENVICF